MSIGRPRQFDPDEALDSAMQLFWRKGYEATSLHDLLEATGLSKSSLYQAFGSKHLLFERSVNRYRRDIVREMEEMLAQAQSGRVFIEQLFLGLSAETHGKNARRGCLLMNTASEFAQSDPLIAKLVKQGTDAFGSIFEAAVAQGKKEGVIPKDKDTRALAAFLLTSLSGLKTLIKAGAGADEVKAVTGVILSALE